uniref:Uncharacterized protein n=1 Tax=Glossina morsitans morsitans TaxID=37546 RepID=A0A1B0G221_GLOMM
MKRVKEELPSTSSPIIYNKEQVQNSTPISIFVNEDVCRRWWKSHPFEYSCQQVHDNWDYHDTVRNNSTYLAHIKCLAFNHGKECIDYRAAAVVANPEVFGKLGADIVCHYEIFKSKSTHPMDNLYSVKIVSLAHFMYYNQGVTDPDEFDISKEILLRIMNYLNQLLYDNME